MTSNEKGQKPETHKIVFFIGKDKFETNIAEHTVRDLLQNFAKVDPKTHTLALKEEGRTIEYKNLDEVITLKNGMHFGVFNNEPTPVS